jgi:hypothetical protein
MRQAWLESDWSGAEGIGETGIVASGAGDSLSVVATIATAALTSLLGNMLLSNISSPDHAGVRNDLGADNITNLPPVPLPTVNRL